MTIENFINNQNKLCEDERQQGITSFYDLVAIKGALITDIRHMLTDEQIKLENKYAEKTEEESRWPNQPGATDFDVKFNDSGVGDTDILEVDKHFSDILLEMVSPDYISPTNPNAVLAHLTALERFYVEASTVTPADSILMQKIDLAAMELLAKSGQYIGAMPKYIEKLHRDLRRKETGEHQASTTLYQVRTVYRRLGAIWINDKNPKKIKIECNGKKYTRNGFAEYLNRNYGDEIELTTAKSIVAKLDELKADGSI